MISFHLEIMDVSSPRTLISRHHNAMKRQSLKEQRDLRLFLGCPEGNDDLKDF